MSWQAAVVRWAIRRKMRRGPAVEDSLFGVARDADPNSDAFVATVRRALDRTVASLPAPMRGTAVDRIETGTVRGEWITAPSVPRDAKRVIPYCHGGAFFWGNLAAPRNMLARLSRLTGARVFSLDYRLAPEAPFPAALVDAAAAYAWLLEAQWYSPSQVIVGGESSGAGLVLSLLAALKGKTRVLPAAAFLFSPWTDLTLSGGSIETNAASDPVLSAADLRWAAGLYLNGTAPDSARASPLFATLAGLPPILLQTGSEEILLDDSRRLAETLQRHGGRCTLDVWPQMHHVWQLHSFFLPEGRRALTQVARFIDETVAAA